MMTRLTAALLVLSVATAATILLASGFRLFWQNNSLMVYDLVGPTFCSLTWEDLHHPCSMPIALFLADVGIVNRSENAYVLYKFDPGFDVGERRLIPYGCKAYSIRHVGNLGTTLYLSDAHVYYILPIKDQTFAPELQARRNAIMNLCIARVSQHSRIRVVQTGGRIRAVARLR